LTNIEVKQAKQKKLYKLSDGKGLLLRVKPNGFKLGYLITINPKQNHGLELVLVLISEVSLANDRKKV